MIVIARFFIGLLTVLTVPALGMLFNLIVYKKAIPEDCINDLFVRGTIVLASIILIIFFAISPCYYIGSLFI